MEWGNGGRDCRSKKTHDVGIDENRGLFVEALYCDVSFVYSCIKNCNATPIWKNCSWLQLVLVNRDENGNLRTTQDHLRD